MAKGKGTKGYARGGMAKGVKGFFTGGIAKQEPLEEELLKERNSRRPFKPRRPRNPLRGPSLKGDKSMKKKKK